MKYKPLILLIGLSMLILLSVGTYQWWQNQQNLHAVAFLSDPNWSEPVEVIPNIYSQTYDVILEDAQMTVFWVNKFKQRNEEELLVHQVNYQGQETYKPKLLVEDQALRSFTAQRIKDQYHLFWLSGSDGEDLSLMHWALDQDFNVVDEQVLIKHLKYTRDIKSVVEDQTIYLTWFTTRNNFEQVDLAQFDVGTGHFRRREVTNTFVHAEYPNLTVADGQIHLTWLEQNPEQMARGVDDAQNRYFLMYQLFDQDLIPAYSPVNLATAAVERYEKAPQIAVEEKKVHFIWRRYDKENRTKVGTPPLVFYHTAFDWNNLKNYKIEKITNVDTKEPSLQKTADGYLLTYIDASLVVKFASIEYLGEGFIIGEELFPGRRQGFQPEVLVDKAGDQHLIWIEEEATTKKAYYANTKYPHKPGVLETLGISIQLKDMQFISAILYFTVLPLLNVFGNVPFVIIAFVVSILLSLLTWCSRFKYLDWLKFLQSTYVSYLVIMGVAFLQMSQGGSFEPYFYPNPVPEIAPFIMLIATIAALFYLYQIQVKKELSLFVGGVVSLIWYYWITQAALIFNTHSYFLR